MKDILVKIFKISPYILVVLLLASDAVMHLTASYMNTPAKWDDIFYMIASYISDATKEALQACGMTLGK